MVDQWNIRCWNSGTSDRGSAEHLTMKQWNNHDGTVEHLMVEQCNRDGGTVEQRLWNSTTELVEQWNNQGGKAEYLMVEQKNDYDRRMEHLMVEQ